MLEFLIQSKKKNIGVCNSDGVCFLGESSLITYQALSSHFGVTQGTLNTSTGTNQWLHFRLDDKELFVSKISVRYNLSWNHLYSKGLVYGTNNDGLYPAGTPTNQYRTISIGSKLYKCRLLRGSDSDPYDGPVQVYYQEDTHQSEFSRLFYSIVQNDEYMADYNGPKLANYTQEELNISAGYGRYTWCQETWANGTIYRVYRGSNSASYLGFYGSSGLSSFFGWRPVLELVT